MNVRSIPLAALSGLLLIAVFPNFSFHLLAWAALVPLLIALNGQNAKNGFWLGGITGILYFAGTVHWVTNSVHFYGGIPLIPASLITLLLCAYLAIYPALFGAAVVHVRRAYPSVAFLLIPTIWTALELARTYVFSGFPWALLGYSQYNALPVIQMADITGVYGVSFLIVLINTALAEFIADGKKYIPLVVSGVLLAVTLTYGMVRLRAPESGTGLKVAVVQGNIEQDKKWDPAYQAEVIAVYKRLTLEALKEHPDLVIWPETATPFYFGGGYPVDQALTADLTGFVKKNSVTLLFGSPTYEIRPGRAIHLRNSAFLLDREGKVDASYSKHHLVPFGEYVPLKSILFFVGKMVEAIGDFESGNDYTIMTVRPDRGPREDRVSTVICYEIIFPDLVRRFVDRGADIMTTITNDAWFGRTAAPYQHFSMAVFRAVENRVPVARAANTGVSGFIDSKGRILRTSGIFTEAYLTDTIIPGRGRTFYTAWGDVFAYACTVFSVMTLIVVPALSRKKNA